jgi:hypothetical protein
MSYKQFMQELEDDVSPDEAQHRYEEYKSEYITTQKKAYFDLHKNDDWLKNKYHPTNLEIVMERLAVYLVFSEFSRLWWTIFSYSLCLQCPYHLHFLVRLYDNYIIFCLKQKE